MSPSARKVWIEMDREFMAELAWAVAFRKEGVD